MEAIIKEMLVAKLADLSLLVERGTVNPKVVGSSPTIGVIQHPTNAR